MENLENNCTACNSKDKLVLSCSGAADLGSISDHVARKLNADGIRKMSCLALIGASIETSIDSFNSSDILMIDGCSVECGKKILDKNGIANYNYLKISDLGMKKGETDVISENINKVYEASILAG